MANFIMMALGTYRFALATAAYQQLSRQTDYNWQEQERVGRDPLLQWTGTITDQITLQGIILPEFRGGLIQLTHMRAEAARGVPLPLITGLGTSLGLWSITSISEDQDTFWDNGKPRKVGFQISIKKYDVLNLKIKGMNISPAGLINTIADKIK
jgi:phage protein U